MNSYLFPFNLSGKDLSVDPVTLVTLINVLAPLSLSFMQENTKKNHVSYPIPSRIMVNLG